MRSLRRLLFGASFLALVSRSSLSADAASANWQTVQFHSDQQVTISCGAVLLCDITLQPGEHVNAGLGSLAVLWDNQLVYEGENPTTPHLVLKPSRPNLHENVLITTNRRVYRLYLVSTNSEDPTYLHFSFTGEERDRAHHEQRMREIASERQRQNITHSRRRRRRAPELITTIGQACASMSQPGWRMDRKPKEFVPRQVCESHDHTFFALPLETTQSTDLPIPFVATSDGDRPVNYRYDANSRVFAIDGTATEYVLIASSGRHQVRFRIQRIESQAESKR